MERPFRPLALFCLFIGLLGLTACDSGGSNDDNGGDDDPNPFSQVTVNQIIVQDIPFSDPDTGNAWDEDSGPDIYYAFFDDDDNRLAVSDRTFTDTSPDDLPIAFPDSMFVVNDFSRAFTVGLFDLDNDASDDVIGGLRFTVNGAVAETDAGPAPDTLTLAVDPYRIDLTVTWRE
jgi:hypothetical protein